jgi:TM2 domain-containing membrane protein YozV
MQGSILTYNKTNKTGLISGDDGVRYSFTKSDWATKDFKPNVGATVDFEIDEKNARQIFIVKTSRTSERSRGMAALLAFFLGGLGFHKFYLGQTGAGILYLLFFWTLIPALIAFIEFILLLVMSDSEFDRRFNS